MRLQNADNSDVLAETNKIEKLFKKEETKNTGTTKYGSTLNRSSKDDKISYNDSNNQFIEMGGQNATYNNLTSNANNEPPSIMLKKKDSPEVIKFVSNTKGNIIKFLNIIIKY